MDARLRDRLCGSLVGLAVGDALGVALEFMSRGSFEPITDMLGGGAFNLPRGSWTDDTSMALCLAASLCERGVFDPHDQMQRYVRWWRAGYLSSTGTCFDIGGATQSALANFVATQEPFSGSPDPRSAGNGSLMRLAPVPMFYYPNLREMVEYSAESSRTTHAAQECLDACRLFAALLYKAYAGEDKETILSEAHFPWRQDLSPRIAAIAGGEYRSKRREEIHSSGYVVHCLEAAVWCFARSSSFSEATLMAANLGEDADTTAAVCGQLAGAYYGLEAIPVEWREALHQYDMILGLADQLTEKKPTHG